jgi:hypothetical protein
MFWCETCQCAYPHGAEGPGPAYQAHVAASHAPVSAGPREITGRHVLYGLAAAVGISAALRVYDWIM